jgi:hypothetical protein
MIKRFSDGVVLLQGSGSQTGLLPPSPLRTARASFPASSSSLSNALLRTRSCQGHGLHNTRLEPPHRAVHRIPVDGVPGTFGCGECTSGLNHCHLPSLPKRLIKLSCDERPDGRLPAFAWGDVVLDSTPIHPTTGWPLLVPSSHARTSMGCLTACFPLKGDIRGFHVPLH